MTEYDYVDVERAGPKTVITMDDVDTRNALSQGLIDDLSAALERAERDGSTAVVLTGRDGTFCAGGDIGSFTDEGREAMSGRLFGDSDFRRPFDLIEELEKPVIAAVNGTALGGGFELTLVSDIAVVGKDVRMGTPETTIGIAPGVAIVRLVDQIGHHRAMEVMMTGTPITGGEAVEMGLFNAAVPVEEVNDVVDDYVERLERAAPLGVAVTKKVANRHRGGEDRVVSDLALGVLLETDDAQEGLSAFTQKRDPEFRGQ